MGPPTHYVHLVIMELRCNILHSRSIMLSSHAVLPSQQLRRRPAFSAVVVERLLVKEIGEFVS